MKLYKIITIISIFTFVNAQDVFLQVDNYTDGQLELTISNSVDVGGFQFDLDATFADFMVNGASGGASEDAGFMCRTKGLFIETFCFLTTYIYYLVNYSRR